jgi:hypothetical protein
MPNTPGKPRPDENPGMIKPIPGKPMPGGPKPKPMPGGPIPGGPSKPIRPGKPVEPIPGKPGDGIFTTMPVKPGDGIMYPGGSANFDESTGQYRNPSGATDKKYRPEIHGPKTLPTPTAPANKAYDLSRVPDTSIPVK